MHVSIFGEKCGLTPEQVEDVTVSKTWRDLKPGLWNKREQLVVRMVDELHHHSTIADETRSEEHTSELQSLMRISYAVFCLKKKKKIHTKRTDNESQQVTQAQD